MWIIINKNNPRLYWTLSKKWSSDKMRAATYSDLEMSLTPLPKNGKWILFAM